MYLKKIILFTHVDFRVVHNYESVGVLTNSVDNYTSVFFGDKKMNEL